ncbi:MAG: V-type ATP synthase subunit E, partial [Thermoplasmata archaeon]
ILDKANIEAKAIYRDRMKTIIDKNIERADEIIANIRRYKEYKAILKEMADLCVKMIGNDCIINVDNADKSLIAGANVKYGDVDQYGGVLGVSKSGDLELDLRISKIIDDLNEMMRTKLYSQLEG